MRTSIVRAWLIASMLAVAGCGGDPASTTPPAAPTAAAPPSSDQSDTTKLRAASAIGYDGAGLQRSVDRMRTQAANQAKQADEAGGSAP